MLRSVNKAARDVEDECDTAEYRQMETTRMRESSRVGPVGGQSLSVRHVEVERRVLRHDIPA